MDIGGWIASNTTQIATGLLGAGGILYALWQKYLSMKTEKAKAGADVAIAESQREVYQQMNERMTSMDGSITRLQDEVDTLRAHLRERDSKIHSLEMYVQDLQHVLHQHGIEVPPMR